MNLNFLLSELGDRKSVADVEITSVTEQIENVTNGSLFVAIRGKEYDGNAFISEAFDKGAVAVITDAEISGDNIINVSDARTALSFLCSSFYSHPQDEIKIIGITGTNGKTTTAEYLRHILNHAGKKCAVMGTLGVGDETGYSYTGYTTPCPEVLFCKLRELCNEGYEYCVMEVSSQSLAQKRVEPITFKLGILTNVGTDHLDYHGSMQKYVNDKTRLFALSEVSLINADDAYCEEFEAASHGKTYLYSARDSFADFMAKDIRLTDESLSYIMLTPGFAKRVKANTFTDFAVCNTLAAAAAGCILGIAPDTVVEAISHLPDIKGRLQKISADGINVYIDFAHTPEALAAVGASLRRVTEKSLICVFGCGGDRDKSKRSEMGEVAAEFADCIILTSDNPRSEKTDDIIADIGKGISDKKNVFICPDREKAISLALNKAVTGDCVLIAGKGHESFQCVGKEKKFFSDELTVKKILGID